MAGVVQVPPLAQGVGPAVACRLVGAGLVKHDAQVGQVEHGQQPEQQVDKDHPGTALSVLGNENIILP